MGGIRLRTVPNGQLRRNNKIWPKMPFSLATALFCCLIAQTEQQHQHQSQPEPGIWLLDPPARVLEWGPNSQRRLPERTCPTLSTGKDPLTLLPAGVPFRVQWHDAAQLPVEMAKLELFSGDSTGGHLLARLEALEGGGPDGNGSSVSTMAQIPAGLRCASCVLRLSVELDERIQMLSCAQVRVQPVQLDANESAECAESAECGSDGKCLEGQCFCQDGFYGDKCAKENAGPIAAPSSSLQSVRFTSSGTKLHWLASPRENVLRLGLSMAHSPSPSFPPSPRWFILGFQSTEDDPKCQLAMDQWKKRFSADQSDEAGGAARAEAGVLIRVEQEKGENALARGEGGNGREEGGDRPSKLNIHRIDGGNRTAGKGECGANQRWEPCPEARECEPSCDWTASPEAIPATCPMMARSEQQQKCGTPGRCVCAEGFVRLSNSREECKPFAFCQAPEVTASSPSPSPSSGPTTVPSSSPASSVVPADQRCARNETWEKCGNACEPSCPSMYSEEPCGAACEASGCTCADNFVRSTQGQCILWTDCPADEKEVRGKAKEPGQKSAMEDKIVPAGGGTDLAPTKCIGNETLNECGRVCEADCETIFERPECQKCGEPACSCRQGFARQNGRCIYWGDCPLTNSATSTSSSPSPTGNAKTSSPSSSTSVTGVTLAPPKHSGQVEKTRSNATSSPKSANDEPGPMDLCQGKWDWPAGCSGQKCLYSLEWAVDEKTDLVQFSLETRPAVSKKMAPGSPIWSGVGFSPSGTLLDADMIVLEATAGGKLLPPKDMHVDEQLEQLRLDQQQDVQGQPGQFSAGLIRAKFSRKRRTGDSAGEDMDFGEIGNCFRFLFPVSGGRFEQSGNTSVPVADSLYASDVEICVRQCKGGGEKEAEIGMEEMKTDEKKQLEQEKKGTREEEQEKAEVAHSEAESEGCRKEFRWPDGCKEEQCEYRASWAWQAADDSVQFNISSRGIGRWTGIGFSHDGKMAGSDIVTGWVYNQKAYLTDRFAHAQQQPAIDPLDRQDIFDIGGTLIDDVQTISFRRKVISPDRSTDLPLGPGCLHFLFPLQGGRVLARSSRDFQQAKTPIGFHDQQQPIASSQKICLCDRPKDFRPPGQTIGRAKRASAAEEQQAGGPYQCADIAIIQLQEEGNGFLRVVDAFGLSNDSLRRDELWGGRQSIGGVDLASGEGEEEGQQQITIWMRKTLKDASNGNADLTVGRGQIPVFLASGHGPVPSMVQAERLEFAMVDLMAGARELPSSTATPRTASSSSTGSSPIPSSTATPTTASSPSDRNVDSSSSSSTTTAEESTTAIAIQNMEPTSTAADDENGGGQAHEPPPMPAPAFQPSVDQAQPDLGRMAPELFMDENCYGGYAFPEGCMQPAGQREGEGRETVNQCQYTLEWLVQPEMAKVHFQLSARMPADHWTGVGFSADGSMVNADALIVLLLPDGQVSVQDQWSPGYGRPSIDLRQNVDQVSSRWTDGLWSVNFSRPLATGDGQQDVDLLAECQHFLFLHSPNPLMPGSGELRKHVQTPVTSENRICLGKCNQKGKNVGAIAPPLLGVEEDEAERRVVEENNKDSSQIPPETPPAEDGQPKDNGQTSTASSSSSSTTTSSTTTTTISTTTSRSEEPTTMVQIGPKFGGTKGTEEPMVQVASGPVGHGDEPKKSRGDKKEEEQVHTFNAALRLTNERWDQRLEDNESEQFAQLAQKLTSSLQALLSARWPSLASIRVQKFAEGSVLALLQLRFNDTTATAAGAGEKLPDGKQLKQFLEEAAAEGMMGELMVDREMLEVQEEEEAGLDQQEDKWGPLREMQAWLLAILGLLLLLCIVGALLFCAFRSRRRRHGQARHRTYPNKMPLGHHGNGISGAAPPEGAMFNGGGYQQSQYVAFPCEKDRESDTTTAKTSTTNGHGQQHQQNGGGQQNGKGSGPSALRRTAVDTTPRGIGEATYREWFNKVASKDVQSHYQEHWQMPPSTPLPRGQPAAMPSAAAVSSSPYLSYPNDPAFYTLNGEHRILPPPPAYYRPF